MTLYCDYNGFLIVLNNLIENAIKYNNKNNPYIKIELNDGILSIFNSGKTIDTKNIILVFDRYFQENQENSLHHRKVRRLGAVPSAYLIPRPCSPHGSCGSQDSGWS